MSARQEARTAIASATDESLADVLLDEHDELTNRYYRGDFRPSELSGARFSEAAFRVCQCVCLGSYTPLGSSLPPIDRLLTNLAQVPAADADDGFRIHIPRALRVIYDLRNKRDVAHLGVAVNPNLPDATLVISCASWVLAELVRLTHQCTIEEAQKLVDNIVERTSPLIWAEDDVVRVLDPGLSYRDQVLLILHHMQPDGVPDRDLFNWVEYSQLGAFKRNVLQRLHDERLIEYRDGEARILPPGNRAVDEQYRARLE